MQKMPRMMAVDAVRSFSRSLILLPASQPCVFDTDWFLQGCCARNQRRRAEHSEPVPRYALLTTTDDLANLDITDNCSHDYRL